jgi:hypothetical protein
MADVSSTVDLVEARSDARRIAIPATKAKLRRRLAWLLLFLALGCGYPKVAPYQGVRWDGGAPEVEVKGVWYELRAIDGVPAPEIVAFAQKTYRARWQKRFEEDLVEVMSKMGHRPGSRVTLVLRDPAGGRTQELRDVAMTKENRTAIWTAASGRGTLPSGPPLPREAALADLAQLQRLLEERYSYVGRTTFDHRAAIAQAGARLGERVERTELARAIEQILAGFGDGHLGVQAAPAPGFLPFLLAETEEGIVAFAEDRSRFVEPGHPFVAGLDGVPIARWLDTAGAMVPAGSPQLVRVRALGALREINDLRPALGLPAAPVVRVQLVSASGEGIERELPIAGQRPQYGAWPRGSHRLLDGAIGYLRIATMDGDRRFVDQLTAQMERFRDTRALVIDVRGNGGGARAPLTALFPYFMEPTDQPRIANVAAYRLGPGEEPDRPEGYLADRDLFPITSKVWSAGDRDLLGRLAARWKPAWAPAAGRFSAWHYLALRPRPGLAPYRNPVVVLMDERCFSATDIFLGAFKGWRQVTLMGTASGGGSGRVRPYRLDRSGLTVHLSSMASFRADGSLYDGNGIQPDIEVRPRAGDLIGDSDTALAAALRHLRR